MLSGNGRWGLYAHQFSRSLIENCEVFGNVGGLDPAWGQYTLVTGNLVHGRPRKGHLVRLDEQLGGREQPCVG